MEYVEIGSGMLAEAERLADELPLLNNSIRSGEGAVYGFLGELIFVAVKGGVLEHTYDWDVRVNGVTVDVKTKCVTSEPRPHYDCSVAAFNTSQGCDYYGFVRVLKDMSGGWYLGAMGRDAFYSRATFWEAGQVDDRNGWVVNADCWSVPITELF